MIRILKAAEGVTCCLGFGSAFVYVVTSVVVQVPEIGQFVVDYGYQITIGSMIATLIFGFFISEVRKRGSATISKDAR